MDGTDGRVVTVFGGSGFIGRHLVRRLAATGASVRVAVRDAEAASFLKTMGAPGQIVPLCVDITDPARISAALGGATSAVNLVGVLYEFGRRTFEAIHVDAARAIAQAAAAAGVERLVHLSAIGADAESEAAYGRTKAAGEVAVADAFAGATVVRPSIVFGPEDGFFNLFAGLSRLSWVLPVFGCPLVPKLRFADGGGFRLDLYGDGGTRFQPVYVGDVADAVMRLLADPESAGKTYELGGPTVYSFRQIMDLLLAHIGRRRLLVPLPFAVAAVSAFFLEQWPKPLLTRDQLKLLRRDNVVGAGALTLEDLGIAPTPAEAVLPTYLARYRPPRRQTPQSV